MDIDKAVHRVMQMEAYLDEILFAIKMQQEVTTEMKLKFQALESYMTGGEWLADYERYENGEFPKTLKCGVLSQDTLYDLLSVYGQMINE